MKISAAHFAGLLAAAGAVFWFARNFVLFAYYEETVAVLDGGWFAGVLSDSDWKLANPLVLGEPRESYFEVHVAPFLIPFAYAGKILPLEAGEYMAAFLAAAFALYAALIFIAAADFLAAHAPPLKKSLVALAAAPVAFVVALNGVSAEILHYPHFEIWIPVLLCAFLLALAFEKKKTALAVFVLLLSVREDAGFHLAVTLLAVAFFRQFPLRKNFAAQKESILAQKELLLWSAVALGFALATITLGNVPARPGVFDQRVFSRLASVVLRGDWILALVVVAGWAVHARRPAALVGFAALVPWALHSVLQERPLPGHMGSYYGFPALVALFWPFVAGRFFPDRPAKKTERRPPKKKRDRDSRDSRGPRATSGSALAFAILFAASTLVLRPQQSVQYEEMRVPKVGALQLLAEGASPPPAEMFENIRKLRDFFIARADEMNIIVADGFASLHPHDVPQSRLLYRGPLKLEQDDAGVLIAHSTWLQLFVKSVFAARAAFGLRHAYRLRDSGTAIEGRGDGGFFLFSKEPLCDENGRCADGLPLVETRMGPSFYDLAAAEISRDSFYFPAAAVAAPRARIEEGAVAAEHPGAVVELQNLPLAAGRTAAQVEYLHNVESDSPPLFEVRWAGGGVSANLPPAGSGRIPAAEMIVNLPARRNVTLRVVHNGGGTLRVFGLSLRPARTAADGGNLQ